jgi:diguanylate cyclase (GGDEF)-like protein
VFAFLAMRCGAQPPNPLNSLAAVHRLSNTDAARSLPVRFLGFVTYYEKGNVDLFVQDGDAAIYVETPPSLDLKLGDRVLIDGVTRASFRPEIVAKRVALVSHGVSPRPVTGSFTQMIKGELDCRRVMLHATVRSSNVITDGPSKSLLLDLQMRGGYLQAQIASGGTTADLGDILDREIEITGAVAGKFDSKLQMTGILLEVDSFADVHILSQPAIRPHHLPVQPFDQILYALFTEDKSERVRVEGTITYYQRGAAIVLQDGDKALWVDTLSEEPHKIGEKVIASGFPDVRNGAVMLTRGHIESTISHSPVSAVQADAVQLASGSHAFELVTVEGQLITRVREGAQDRYVIASMGQLFSAVYRHPERGLDLPTSPMQNAPLGSRVRITGICVLDRGDQFQGRVAFQLLLRSSQDIVVVAGPPLISVRNLAIVLSLLFVVAMVAIGRALLLQLRLQRRDATAAASVERSRNRVIEGINNAIPLGETLLQITELLTFKYQAEYCWMQVNGQGTFGCTPPEAARTRLETIERGIPARSGDFLGRVFVAVNMSPKGRRLGPDGLENAVRLASLAVETGSKYSDLVRRSELDPLTDTHNRFAFERALDQLIGTDRAGGNKFALVYIDLDRFKQINDQHGHNVGDRYLQEVSSRLRHQLRSHDILARIGGDEFAILIPNLQTAEELSEIVIRLETCFTTSFSLEKCEVKGSASIGSALFPQDGTTAEALLESADTRMYEIKRQRRQGPIRIPSMHENQVHGGERFGT